MKFRSYKLKLLSILAGVCLSCLSCDDDATIDLEQSKSFVKFYGGLRDQKGSDVKQTPDGGYILLGSTTSFGNGGSDIYLIKVDKFGNEMWSNTYGGPNDDEGKSIQITDDGGYAILGDFQNTNNSTDMYFLKVNAGGEVMFEYTFGNNTLDSNEHGNEVQKTLDGGYILVGSTSNPDRTETGPVDFYLVKTDANGIMEWQRTRGFEDSEEVGNSVVQIDNDNYIVVGTTENARENDQQDGKNIFAYKINANGDNIGNRFYGGLNDDFGNKICRTSFGYAILGTSSSQMNGSSAGENIIMIQIDQFLDDFSTKTFGGAENDQGMSMAQTEDEGFIIVGSTTSFTSTSDNSDIYLVRTDFSGDILSEWEMSPRVFGGQGVDEGKAVIPTEDGFVLIATSTFFETTNNRVLNLIKTDKQGFLIR
ncbi:hypothetical protein QQ020_34080 [Fulvivirgaceae bacterium BMA12]|uniref:Lipoprotein n=1 Tax=Agaribacillus aureus TaxID=3051825 RepID=A0ABT8LJF4_9BACT|nr:hypothetical protein [Fulvivirgaceae bacterium BMA12]